MIFCMFAVNLLVLMSLRACLTVTSDIIGLIRHYVFKTLIFFLDIFFIQL